MTTIVQLLFENNMDYFELLPADVVNLDRRVFDASGYLELARAARARKGCMAIALSLVAGGDAVPAPWVHATVSVTELYAELTAMQDEGTLITSLRSKEHINLLCETLHAVPNSGVLVMADINQDGEIDHSFGVIGSGNDNAVSGKPDYYMASGTEVETKLGTIWPGVTQLDEDVLKDVLSLENQYMHAFLVIR